MSAMYPCPCCGYLVFQEPPGSYIVCPLCLWEDDALQLEFATTLAGGANSTTLLEAQRNVVASGAADPALIPHVRQPGPNDAQDPRWRLIDESRDTFEQWGSPNPSRAPRSDGSLYYWSDHFWRHASQDRV